MVFDREDEQIIDNALTPAGTFDFNPLLCSVSEIASSISPKILSLILTPIKGILDDYSTRKRVKDMKHVLQVIVNAIRHLDVSKLDEEYLATADYSMHMKKLIRITRDEERKEKLEYIRNSFVSVMTSSLDEAVINDALIHICDSLHQDVIKFTIQAVIRDEKIRKQHHIEKSEVFDIKDFKKWTDQVLNNNNNDQDEPTRETLSDKASEFLYSTMLSQGLIILDSGEIWGDIGTTYFRLSELAHYFTEFVQSRHSLT